jgi:hypothetical protein
VTPPTVQRIHVWHKPRVCMYVCVATATVADSVVVPWLHYPGEQELSVVSVICVCQTSVVLGGLL